MSSPTLTPISFTPNTLIKSADVNSNFSSIQTIVQAATSAASASTLMYRDANVNAQINNIVENLTSTATAAGTTTLTVSSSAIQVFTGSTTQTVKLPDCTTLPQIGFTFTIVNNSSGALTVNNNGSSLVKTVSANTTVEFICTSIGSANGSWSTVVPGGGTVTSVATGSANGLSFTGGPITTSGTLTPVLTAPTVQNFTSGSGTYTTPTSPSPLYIRVRMVGGGGGGSGSASTAALNAGNGGNGGATTFGTSLLNAGGGNGGAFNGTPGQGGSASLGSGPIGIALVGGNGGGSQQTSASSGVVGGGMGASSALGGSGSGGGTNYASGNGTTNTGGGGGGASIGSSGANMTGGSGGGSGGYVEAIISSPSATYSYAVGAAGSAGSAGTSGNAGGAGGSGYISVTEYYQ